MKTPMTPREIVIASCFQFSMRLLSSPHVSQSLRNEILRIRDEMTAESGWAERGHAPGSLPSVRTARAEIIGYHTPTNGGNA